MNLAQMLMMNQEQQFQKGIRDTDWFREFQAQYGEAPDLRQMSEDPQKGPNYDYRAAWQGGIRPERDPYDNNRYHWGSSLPSGEMLKSKNHPTAWKEQYMREYGINPDAVGAKNPNNLSGGMFGGGR